MLYIAYFIIVSGHNTKNCFCKNFPFLTCRGWKTVQFVHTPNAIEPPTNSKFWGFWGAHGSG